MDRTMVIWADTYVKQRGSFRIFSHGASQPAVKSKPLAVSLVAKS